MLTYYLILILIAVAQLGILNAFGLIDSPWTEGILDKFLFEVKGQEQTNNENNPSATSQVSWSDNVQAYHLLFPIPAAEMESNSSMAGNQNPGY